jgi:hypothetical protein
MEPLLNIKVLLIGVLLMVSTNTSAHAAGDFVSAADAQHFEQTYEDWAKSILKGINPKLNFTVLSEIEFSRNPERLQEYEDMKAANHLPGLPEMADPNYSNPLESPLFSLVAKKDFKIIIRSSISPTEMNLVREVLNSKLKITSADSLRFENLDEDSAPAHTHNPFHTSKTTLFTLLAGLVLVGSAIFSARHKLRFKIEQKNNLIHALPTVSANDAGLAAPPAHNPMLSASHQIQMASPEVLRKVLLNEKAELIARASLNATKKFSNRILGECEQSKFDLVIQWINANHKNISHQDSNYARLLLAARIQQVQNAAVLNSIDAFNRAREMKAQLNAKQVYKITPAKEVNEAQL